MPTIMETLDATKASSVRLSRCKPTQNMNISASIDLKKSQSFHLVSVKLLRVPLLFAAGCTDDGPIIIDKNFSKIGKLNCDFIPKVIVLSGRNALRAAKKSRELTCAAWVGDGALKPLRIMAADSLSNSVLEDKLSQLIRSTYAVKKNTAADAPYAYDYDLYPYLKDVFQSDGYCIFSLGKAMYRQNYKIDPKTRNVTLDGQKVEVFQTYQPAPSGDVSSSASDSSPYSCPANASLAKGAFAGPTMNSFMVDSTTFGAPNSEANNPQLKLMLNVEEALEQYLALIKSGNHKPVGMAGLVTAPTYMNAARETSIALKERGNTPANFSTIDFLKWQDKRMNMKAAAQTKVVHGETLIASDFAYVGDPRDISTWHLPMASASLVKTSLQSASACSAVPKLERADVREKLMLASHSFGLKSVETSGKTTNKKKRS